jgi:hypothetical protein
VLGGALNQKYALQKTDFAYSLVTEIHVWNHSSFFLESVLRYQPEMVRDLIPRHAQANIRVTMIAGTACSSAVVSWC